MFSCSLQCEGYDIDEDGSSAPEQDITPSQQDSSTVIEDTLPSPTQVRQSCTSLHMYTQLHCTCSVYINCWSSDAFRPNTHPDRPFSCMSGTTVWPVSARVCVGAQSRSMRASRGRGFRARCAPESDLVVQAPALRRTRVQAVLL